jgi:myosin heavy subunit
MLMRICLIVAILAGLAAAGLNLVTVKEKITTTLKERDDFHTERDKEASDKRKALALAKDTQGKLDKTTEELTSTKDERDKAVADAAEQTKRAAALADNLKTTQQQRDAAQNDLAAWKALGIPVDQIKATLAKLKTVSEERDIILEEKRILIANNKKYKEKIDSILNPEHTVELPEGLKGKVLVTDPKYDFVVLDIGEKQGVLEDGQMLVNRNGKLIAKVRIKSVQSDRSIANVMPGWKQADIMEGDQVLY